jgi:hypothetical protein
MPRTDDHRHVERVCASITLLSDAEKREQAERFKDRAEIVQNLLDPGRYQMYGALTAILSDGARIATEVRDFGFSGPKDGLGAIAHRYQGPKLSEDPEEQTRLLRETYHVGYTDVVDSVNRMLGRDPDVDPRPRLAWGNLIKALATADVNVSEQQLIDLPLDLALSDEVKTEIRLT